MSPDYNSRIIRLGIPKGRMQAGVITLMAEAGIKVKSEERTYRPGVSLAEFEAKILKPQSIAQMLQLGSRDIGFAGRDWIEELGVDVVELLDTGLDPVRLVAAAPKGILENGKLPKKQLLIASEYENITLRWIKASKMDARLVRSYGATEVFPPEDADCIVDNSASGETLRANNLIIVEELMRSSTRLYASPVSMKDPIKRERIEHFAILLRSVLDARKRVMLEVKVEREKLEAVVSLIPAIQRPSIAELRGLEGFVVKGAVFKNDLPQLIARIRAAGGTDLVITTPSQIVM